MSLPAFDRALKFTLSQEGGFVDHASDPGGATYAGVSLRTVGGDQEFDLDGDGDVDREDIKLLAKHPERVAKFYLDRFWSPLRCSELPPHLALFAFDAAVNHGPRPAVVLLQKGIGVRPDGMIGPQTIEKAHRSWGSLESCLVERAELYARIIAARPASLVFRRGWMRRLFALQREATYLVRDIASGKSN